MLTVPKIYGLDFSKMLNIMKSAFFLQKNKKTKPPLDNKNNM